MSEFQAVLHGRTHYDLRPASLQILLSGRIGAPPNARALWVADGEEEVVDEWLMDSNDSCLSLRKLAASTVEVRQWMFRAIEISGKAWSGRSPVCVSFAIDIGSVVIRASANLGTIDFSLNQYVERDVFRRWLLISRVEEVESFGKELTGVLETWGDWDP